MRLRAILFAVLALGSAGAAAWQGSVLATDRLERLTAAELRDALAEAGEDWAEVAPNGLIVTLTGAAPDERGHLRAIEVLHSRVGMHRIDDRSTVRPAPTLPEPSFALELLRNRGEISLIGLAPDDDSRERIHAALAAAGLGTELADMMDTADHPAPPGWEASLAFGLDVVSEMPRARVAVAPGAVTVAAVLANESERASIAAALRAGVPRGVALHLDLTAPRPVIAPFQLDFRLDANAASLLACSAETEEAAAAILAAAREAGLDDEVTCTLGLGAPSADWTSAATEGIAALKALGGGGFALTDSQAKLIAPPDVDTAAIDAAARQLAAALPGGYALTTVVPSHRDSELGGSATARVPRFHAVLDADGKLELRGAVHDAVSQTAIASYAAALFGHDRVSSETAIDPGLPEGWPVRVLAGLEALAEIAEGRLEITSDSIVVSGRSLDAEADARVEALLAARTAGAMHVDVRFDALAAERAAAAARPAPERCADEVGAILENEAIVFRPGSAEIDPISSGVLAAIADVLRECPGAVFEIAGHTDSSGRAETNQRLSETRAAAVAAALESHDLPLIEVHPRGYGASRPRASNTTPEGRALNRRIELVLLDPEAVRAAALAPDPAPSSPPAAAAEADCVAEVAAILDADPIEFDLGSSRISADSATVLERVAAALSGCGNGKTFEIAGHTDDRGPAEVNQRLSEERAEAVRAALAEGGLDAVELVARGYGPDRPIADNATLEGRTRNRRIEITLLSSAADAAQEPTAIDGSY